jgi:hypothetical protein
MSITEAGPAHDSGLKSAEPTILRAGFRHPRSQAGSMSSERTEPPQIKWRACSWDAIDDQRDEGSPP